MIEQTQHGTMFSGRESTSFFRMKMQLEALRFRVQTGMELARRFPIMPMVRREYGLKGNAAKLLAQFEPIVQAAQAKQLVTIELPDTPPKVKRLPLKAKPDFVYWPVTRRREGWMLGKVEPDVKGYTPTNILVQGESKDAEDYCFREAADRGISRAQHAAAVGSSMFPAEYFHVLKSENKPRGK